MDDISSSTSTSDGSSSGGDDASGDDSGLALLSMESDASIQTTHYIALTLSSTASAPPSVSDPTSSSSYTCHVSTSPLSSLPSSAVAWATYEPTMMTQGWDILTVSTSSLFTDVQQSYAAGYVEGWATRVRMQQWWAVNRAQVSYDDETWRRIHLWMNRQITFIQDQVALYSASSTYWRQVGLIMAQINGMVDGHNDAFTASNLTIAQQAIVHTMSVYDLFMMNADGDLYDVCKSISSISTLSST